MEEARRRRIRAAWADIGLLLIALIPFGAVAGGFQSGPDEYGLKVEDWAAFMYFVFVLAYFFVLESTTGQTLGKRWFGVLVRDRSGNPAGTRAIAIRTILRVLDWLPFFYLSGYIAMRLSGERDQRIGDRAAGTSVRLADATRPAALPPVGAIAVLAAIAAATLTGAAVMSDDQGEDAPMAPTDRAVVGEGFRTSVPSDWVDQTEQIAPRFEAGLEDSGFEVEIDHVLAGDRSYGSGAVVIAHETRPLSAALSERVRELNEFSERSIPEFEIVGGPDPSRLDGRDGITFEYTGMPSGPVRVRHLSALSGKTHYILTLTAPPEGFDAAAPVFARIIESWRWSDMQSATDEGG